MNISLNYIRKTRVIKDLSEISDNSTEIEQEEIEEAVQKLKSKKSPGLDDISKELVKYGGLV